MSSVKAIKHPRYWHVACLAEPVSVRDAVAAREELGDAAHAHLEPYVEAAGVPALVSLDPVVRGAAGAQLCGPAAPLPVAPPPTVAAEAGAALPSESACLRNMGWWANGDGDALVAAYTNVDSLLINGAHTLSELPGCLKLAIGDAREAAAREVIDALADEDELGAWKLFLAFDRLIFGQLLDRSADGHTTVANRVSARLRLFWDGQWASLAHDSLRTSAAGAPVNAVGAEVRRVRRLVLQGEVGKATAAAWGAKPLRTPAETEAAFMAQRHAGPQAQDSNIAQRGLAPEALEQLRADVESHLRASWRSAPRGARAGPQGDRFEHWAALSCTELRGEACASVLGRLVTGQVPQEALELALAGKLLGLVKQDGGTRVLACGAVARRLVARAVAHVRRDMLTEQATDMQFAVGRKCGIEEMHKSITAHAESVKDMAIVSVDFRNAFTRIRRRMVLRAVERRCPALADLFVSWYERTTKHVVSGGVGAARVVQQADGLDQGCPLSPAFFAIGEADQLSALRAWVRGLDPRCCVWSYLDDLYFSCPKGCVGQALAKVHELFGPLGLELNPGKTRVWCPDGDNTDVPAALTEQLVTSLPCLGSTVGFVRQRVQDEDDGEWREVNAGIADGTAPGRAAGRLRAYVARLRCLHEGGLELQYVMCLLRSWCNAAFTHYQRALLAESGAWREVDDVLVEAVAAFFGGDWAPWSRDLVFLPAKEGGLGFRSAESSADPAWAASWYAVEGGVRQAQGAGSIAAAEAGTPLLTAAVSAVRDRLRAAGVGLMRDSGGNVSQGAITRQLERMRLAAVRAALPEGAAALRRSHGGTGALLLAPPMNGHHLVPDEEFIVAVRERLLVADPACQGKTPCQNASREHGACGHREEGMELAIHGRTCCVGPGFVRRHHGLRDAVGGWLEERHGAAAVAYEQRVPAWDMTTDEGTKLAVLDVVVHGPYGRQFVDVTVVDPLSAQGASMAARARADGVAARDRQREKHARYPGPALVAAAVEAGGRMGIEFEAFLRSHAPPADAPDRLAALRDGRMRAVIAAVRGTATMLLTSAGTGPKPWWRRRGR